MRRGVAPCYGGDMPVERCQREGRPGWRWGGEGHCFIGPDAKAEAEEQGRAIAASQMRNDVLATAWYLRQDAVSRRAFLGVCAAAATATVLPGGVAVPPGLVRHLRGDARRRKPPRQAQPNALERRYRAQLRRRVRQVRAVMEEALKHELKKRGPDIDARARSDAFTRARRDGTLSQDMAALLRVVDRVEKAVTGSVPIDISVIERLGQQINSFTQLAVAKQITTVVGIDITAAITTPTALVDAWTATNMELLKSLDSRYFDDIRKAVRETIGEGKSTFTLSDELAERFGVSQSRADLIAVDQTGTLNAQVTRIRQTTLGIEEYIWSNSGDGRVRPLHEEIDGNRYSWAEGHPTEGHPQEPIRCRCSAIPIL